ncbi:MAG: hypothetical protein Q7T70_06205 [Polaromonas sp.]|nr:hypothetical protein [Polaromonas sp.]
MTPLGHRQKYLSINNGFNGHAHPLFLGLGLVRLHVLLVENVITHVGRVTEQLLHPVARPLGTPALDPAFLQVRSNLEASHLGAIEAPVVKLEDSSHRGRFGLINHKPLFLALGRWQVQLFGLVAKRRFGAIEEALAGVLLQGPQRVLSGFLALVLIEHAENLAGHLAARVVAGLLGDRDELAARLFQLAFVERELQRVPEKPRQAVHDDGLIGRGLERCVGDHLLKLWPPVVGGRGSRLDIFLGDVTAVALRPVPHLSQLVGDG